MKLVDANILLYAEDAASPRHEAAVAWWDEQLSGGDPVCLCWPVLTAFIRIGTTHHVFRHPLSTEQALERIRGWLDQPCTRIVRATERHFSLLSDLMTESKASGNLTTDAHIATLAIEHGCTLYSTDADFARFRSLTWIDPLEGR